MHLSCDPEDIASNAAWWLPKLDITEQLKRMNDTLWFADVVLSATHASDLPWSFSLASLCVDVLLSLSVELLLSSAIALA